MERIEYVSLQISFESYRAFAFAVNVFLLFGAGMFQVSLDP